MGVYLNEVLYSVDIKRPPPLHIFQGQSDVSRGFRRIVQEICVIHTPIQDIESILSFLSRKNINVKRSNPILMILQKGNERLGAISVGQDERSNGTTYCKDKMLNKLTFFLLQVLNNFANEQ